MPLPTPRSQRDRPALTLTTTAAAATALLFSTLAPAHGPTRQKVVEKISIDAPASVVWSKVKNFDALKDWHPAVGDSPADKGNSEGSVRQVKLRDGGVLTETLETYDDAKMRYSYRAKDGGALPVTNYTSTFSVSDNGGKASVEWRGAFYRGFPNNDPPADQNDEAAVKAVTGLYQGGLAHLKKLVEGK